MKTQALAQQQQLGQLSEQGAMMVEEERQRGGEKVAALTLRMATMSEQHAQQLQAQQDQLREELHLRQQKGEQEGQRQQSEVLWGLRRQIFMEQTARKSLEEKVMCWVGRLSAWLRFENARQRLNRSWRGGSVKRNVAHVATRISVQSAAHCAVGHVQGCSGQALSLCCHVVLSHTHTNEISPHHAAISLLTFMFTAHIQQQAAATNNAQRGRRGASCNYKPTTSPYDNITPHLHVHRIHANSRCVTHGCRWHCWKTS